jgi:hypothetical protein
MVLTCGAEFLSWVRTSASSQLIPSDQTKCPLVEPGVPTLLLPNIGHDVSTRGYIVSNIRVSEDLERSGPASSRYHSEILPSENAKKYDKTSISIVGDLVEIRTKNLILSV